MDKAPDAFRTISEVADDLDVPQHVLRFWETRFNQIKPMKRSGGRRYYRPDDVDLLRGIRHLLYGQGYTIRGVQRILKEQGVKAVQNWQQIVAASPAKPKSGDASVEAEPAADGDAATVEAEAVAPDESETDETAVAVSRIEPRLQPEVDIAVARPLRAEPGGAIPAAGALSRSDVERLRSTLDDLIACRTRLEDALAEN